MTKATIVFTLLGAPFVVACSPLATKTSSITPTGDKVRSAGPGDIVMSFQSRKALPNIVGGSDIWGRTTNAGSTTVRFVGTYGARAIFERMDIIIENNATTISESPMIFPQRTITTVGSAVGQSDIYGAASSTTYKYIPPRGSSQHAIAQRPISIVLGNGESVAIQGHKLNIINVSANVVNYTVD